MRLSGAESRLQKDSAALLKAIVNVSCKVILVEDANTAIVTPLTLTELNDRGSVIFITIFKSDYIRITA